MAFHLHLIGVHTDRAVGGEYMQFLSSFLYLLDVLYFALFLVVVVCNGWTEIAVAGSDFEKL